MWNAKQKQKNGGREVGKDQMENNIHLVLGAFWQSLAPLCKKRPLKIGDMKKGHHFYFRALSHPLELLVCHFAPETKTLLPLNWMCSQQKNTKIEMMKKWTSFYHRIYKNTKNKSTKCHFSVQTIKWYKRLTKLFAINLDEVTSVCVSVCHNVELIKCSIEFSREKTNNWKLKRFVKFIRIIIQIADF